MLLNEQNLTTSFTHHGSLAQKMPVILLLAVIVCVSVISGILAAFGNVVVLVALLALYGMFFILVTPVKWIVWIIFWMVFVITGLTAYFWGRPCMADRCDTRRHRRRAARTRARGYRPPPDPCANRGRNSR